MANENLIELIFQAKDEASQAVANLRDGLNSLSSSSKSTGDSASGLSAILENLKNMAAGAAAVVGVLGLGAALKSSVSSTEELGSEIRKLQLTTGMTAESASELIAVANHVGVGFDTLQAAIAAVERRMGGLKTIEDQTLDSTGKAVDIFDKFGISIRDSEGNLKPFSDIFEEIRQRVQAAVNPTEQMAIATQFFRFGAAELMPLLTMTSEEYKALAEDARKYGLVLSQDNVDAIHKYVLAHRDMDEAFQGAKIALGTELMPLLTEFANWIADNIGWIKDLATAVGITLVEGFSLVKGIIQEVIAVLMLAVPAFWTLAAAAAAACLDFNKTAEYLDKAKQSLAAASIQAKAGVKTWTDVGTVQANTARIAAELAAKQKAAADAAAKAADEAKKAAEDQNKIEDARLKTLEASVAFEKAVLDKFYADGKISKEDYVKRMQELDDQEYKAQLKLMDDKIAAAELGSTVDLVELGKLYQDRMQLVLKHGEDQFKEEQKTEDRARKLRQDAFDEWKNLQDLKIKEMKAYADLGNAIDEAAVQAGTMRESDAMQNKLDRLKGIYDKEIADAEAAAAKIEENTGTWTKKEIDDHQKALEAKKTLQDEWQVKVVTSSQEITSTQEKEEADFTKFIAGLTGDRVALAKVEADQKLAELNRYWQQGLVGEEQYAAAKKAIEEKEAKDSADTTTQALASITISFNDAADAANALVLFWRQMSQYWAIPLEQTAIPAFQNFAEKVRETYKDVVGTISSALSTVQDQYAALKSSGINSLSDAASIMKDLAWQYKTNIEGFYTWMTGTGKAIAASVGMTVQQYVTQISDYINYVRGLMASLQDQISSYQDQLDQLLGNNMAILDRWYASEKQKLIDKYKDQLGNTQDFYKAMQLLDELYAEKKKQILDQMKQNEQDYFGGGADQQQSGAGGAAGSSYSGNNNSLLGNLAKTITPPPTLTKPEDNPFQGFADQVKKSIEASFSGAVDVIHQAFAEGAKIGPNEIKVSKEINLDSIFELKSLDPDSVVKTCHDVIFPEWEKYLKLKGITLG